MIIIITREIWSIYFDKIKGRLQLNLPINYYRYIILLIKTNVYMRKVCAIVDENVLAKLNSVFTP